MYINFVELGSPRLEWDESKRLWTLETRKLDFSDLDRFDWDTALTSEDRRTDYGETRFVSLGFLDGRLMAVAYTLRDDAYRIISLRKANQRERKIYDDATPND